MTKEEIKNVFDTIFNNLPNPIFNHPVDYIEHGNYLIEVADCPKEIDTKPEYVTPRKIFEMLFVADGYWVTVLEKAGNNYHRRVDMDYHINNIDEINKILQCLE